jgi:hypothetical protein
MPSKTDTIALTQEQKTTIITLLNIISIKGKDAKLVLNLKETIQKSPNEGISITKEQKTYLQNALNEFSFPGAYAEKICQLQKSIDNKKLICE